MFGDNPSGAGNQQERPGIEQWVVGFVDGEGCFSCPIQQNRSMGMGWQVPRLPGLGEVPWNRFIASLIAAGYDGVVSVEHEDRSFEGDLELVKRGFLLARNTLQPLLV